MHAKNSLLLHHHHLPQIPEEIVLEEILPRLPVKSLLRFRCVSKSWLSLIECDRFIKTQYHNSTKNPSWAYHRVVLSPGAYEIDGKQLEECSLRRLMRSSNEGSSSIDDDGTTLLRKEYVVVGCYNGVVCLLDTAERCWSFSLWNPSTRNSTELPTMRGGSLLKKYGFGWDQSRGAYKVFAVFLFCRHSTVVITPSVYSSETDSWKAVTGIETIGYSCSSGIGLFVGRSLHWLRYSRYDVESFDLEREASGTIELPPTLSAEKYWPPQLGEIGGSLSILLFDEGKKRSVDVWVMKEYGVKDSWFKLLTFPAEKIMSMDMKMMYVFFSQFGEGPNGEIFFVSEAGFMAYSPKDATLTVAKHGIDFGYAHVYVESLVSPPRRRSSSSTKVVDELYPCNRITS